MITELRMAGFRGFEDFSLHDLGRINLLVGPNNGGKTSVLEAIEFFASRGEDIMPLCNAMTRRGECKWRDSELEIDISHLFYGHKTEPDIQFSITGKRATSMDTLQGVILESDPDDIPDRR